MWYQLLFAFLIILFYSIAYRVSLYSLAVNLDPDELESLYDKVSQGQKKFLERLAADPQEFVQVGVVYKAISLVAITVAAVLFLISVPIEIALAKIIIWSLSLLTVWIGYVLIVEYLPRRSSRTAINSKMIKKLWYLRIITFLMLPIVRKYRSVIIKANAAEPVTEEEKEEIVERAIEALAEQAGIGETLVEEDEKEMIGQIFLLDQKVVREVMIPRVEITGIEKSMSFKKIREVILQDGHSRYPVYDEAIDKVVGMIYVKDLFNQMPGRGETFDISRYLRKPYFVNETKVIGDLLQEFKVGRQHIAIVMDDLGGVAGLITLEDIIEEIVGEIHDEHDTEEEEFIKLTDGRYLINATMRVERLQDYLDTDHDEGDYETVGGLLYNLAGTTPVVGQKLKWNDLEFEIDKVEKRRIKLVKVSTDNTQH
ncbi:MAG: HlyC/CorC family transporter [candidate division Zixibacteria bacterium]|nr:HlyC/CorC family transporter [candidate division Zixibacteria bacterium]